MQYTLTMKAMAQVNGTNSEINMALITCLECGKEVSSLATACPSCAYPLQGIPQAEERSGETLANAKAARPTSKKTMILAVATVALVFLGFGVLGALGYLSFGKRLNTDENTKAALVALKKLGARTESGVSYGDYTPMLGDAYLLVKVFQESESAKINPTFTQALVASLEWYKTANDAWTRKIKTGSNVATCEYYSTDGSFGAQDFCISHPEFKSMLMIPRLFGNGKKEGLGIDFENAIQKSWHLAGEEFRKAEQMMK